MSKLTTQKIDVLSSEVRIATINDQDFICLTDIVRHKGTATTDDLIRNWLRNRNTVEFLGLWEQINNPGFNPVEFDGIRMQAGLNSFTLTPKQWIERTGAIGNIHDQATGNQLVCLAIQQMQLLNEDERLPRLPGWEEGK